MRPLLHIHLDAIAHNYRVLRALAPAARVGAVVKADAYGLGAEPVSRALYRAGCRLFMVALPEEGERLRPVLDEVARGDGSAARDEPEIWVLNGAGDAEDGRICTERRLTAVLNTPEQVALHRGMAGDALPPVIGFDTGMNRLGLRAADEGDFSHLRELQSRAVMSHLACSGQPRHPLNAAQLRDFSAICAAFAGVPRSLANSGGMLLGEVWQMDICRPGIALYGGVEAPGLDLRRAVTVEAPVLQVRQVARGESVGYNARWTAERDSWVAIAGLGYADGWCGEGLQALADKVLVPVIGEVSMDLIALDVTCGGDNACVSAGDSVALVGEGLSLSRQAECAGQSPYELLTGLGARYERVYS